MEFILGIIVFALSLWAIVNVWQSPEAPVAKLLWTIGIIIFPVIGVIVWYFAGPRGRTAIA